jgi:uncharacterized protein
VVIAPYVQDCEVFVFYRLEKEGLLLIIKVVANARRSEWNRQNSEEYLSVRVAGVRDKGKANKELIAYLSGTLGVSSSKIEIVSGSTAPHKKVRILCPNPEALVAKILEQIEGK